MDGQSAVLTINTGSSSLKAALYQDGRPHRGEDPIRLLSADARQLGQAGTRFTVKDASGHPLASQTRPLADHAAALEQFFEWLKAGQYGTSVAAVGHRLVHGGLKYRAPLRITGGVIGELEALVPLAPVHLPQALGGIIQAQRLWPDAQQVACFDTAFHADLPERARILPLSRKLADEGIVRFGFHGLSCEYLVARLRELEGNSAGGRAVLAHLGNGASITAVDRGRGIDTSMGLTPAGGIVMGTRSGDLDPGVLIYLLNQGRTPAELDRLVNAGSGLLGLSEISGDMRVLLERQDDPRAAEAIEIFCYHAQKFIGAYAAALGGLDTLVFTGGIGENAPLVRKRICAGLEFLGIEIDEPQNAAAAELISPPSGRVAVRVIKTDEDLVIARHTCRLLSANA
jgi:acetate kinase